MSTSGVLKRLRMEVVTHNRWDPSTCRVNIPRCLTTYVSLDNVSLSALPVQKLQSVDEYDTSKIAICGWVCHVQSKNCNLWMSMLCPQNVLHRNAFRKRIRTRWRQRRQGTIFTCESTTGSQHVCKTVVTWKSGLVRINRRPHRQGRFLVPDHVVIVSGSALVSHLLHEGLEDGSHRYED